MSRDAASLRCPACGANVAPDAGRCPYCRARLATISCPFCFALMFDTAAYCQQCGTKRQRADAKATASKCPACRVDMERVTVGDTPLLECRTCDGIWVDAADFERICAGSEAQSAVLHHVVPRTAVRPTAPVKYRPCVRCSRMMNRLNFGQFSGTVVDVCRGHGTFLDAGELHAIVTFIRGGGLERARQRRIEELKAEEQRLELKRTKPQPGDRGWGSEIGGEATLGLLDLIDLLKNR
jgi:Zn-finger nucleic acid-binding protein